MSAHSDSPETEIYAAHKNDVYEFVDPEWDWVVSADFARNLERQRNEAREENARLRDVLANATCLILAVGEPKETAGCQHGWYEARTMVLQQVNKLTP